MTAPLVPELDVTDLDASLAFYCDVLGFQVRYLRPEERFAYLKREDAELMLEEAAGPVASAQRPSSDRSAVAPTSRSGSAMRLG